MKSKLMEFLKKIAKEGYAGDNEKDWIKGNDGSTIILFGKPEDEWFAKDIFYGGEPYSGIETIFYQGKAFWAMVYYGKVNEKVDDVNEIYSFLRKALLKCPEELPIRGPRTFSEENYIYQNNWKGQIEEFEGQEEILIGDKKVYEAKYIGGYVNQRRGD